MGCVRPTELDPIVSTMNQAIRVGAYEEADVFD
jgi:hypothetical protein